MSSRLKDKVSIITGGASGIGEAATRIFSDEGSKVVIADMDVDKGKVLRDEINSNNGNAIFIKINVANEKEWDELKYSVYNKLRFNKRKLIKSFIFLEKKHFL